MKPRALAFLFFLIGVFPLFGQAQTGNWAPRSPTPLNLTEVSTAVVGGKIYVVGGLLASSASNSALQIYDPELDTWTLGPPLPLESGVDHANVAAAGGKLYVLGGLVLGQGRATDRTFEFDPATNTWQEKAPMPTMRGASGTAELSGKIYVAGGQRDITVNEFAVYDPAANTWTPLPVLPTARNHLTAQAVGGKFYAIGGRSASLIGAVEMYDPDSNTWTPRAPMLTPRGGLASATLRGRIQVIGGEGSNQPGGTFRENEEYDPATNTWQALTPMPTPRHGFYAVALNRRLYAPCGGPRAGLFTSTVNEVFYFPPDRAPDANAAGLVDAASFRARLAAGALVSLFGTGLADARAQAVRFPLPASVYEASVLVNGRAVPLLYVSERQINFQLPFDAVGAVSVRVNNAGLDGAAFNVTVQQVAPAIFAGAVVHNSTFRLVTSTEPATRGEALAVLATGLGPVQPPVEAGVAAPGSPLSTITLPVTVMLGGSPAPVLFSGLAPGFAGLYQVNFTVPNSIQPGSNVPLILTVDSVPSNTVNIAIQ